VESVRSGFFIDFNFGRQNPVNNLVGGARRLSINSSAERRKNKKPPTLETRRTNFLGGRKFSRILA